MTDERENEKSDVHEVDQAELAQVDGGFVCGTGHVPGSPWPPPTW